MKPLINTLKNMRWKIVLPLLLLPLLILLCKPLLLNHIFGEGETGEVNRVNKIPFVGNIIADFPVNGSLHYILNTHPHGTVYILFSGNTTDKQSSCFFTSVIPVTQLSDGMVKQEAINKVNQRHTDNPNSFPVCFTEESLAFWGHNSAGDRILAVYRPSDGAFIIECQFRKSGNDEP